MQQLLVAGCSLLAGLSGGSSVGFAGVLMQQLAANDSSIHLDLATTSWIGSIHSLTGVPSIILPIFAQWRGRKIGFMAVCLISIIGWILASTASSSTTILISESVIGIGAHSVLTIVLINISEMISPEYRAMAMVSFFVTDSASLALVEIAGKYLHWKTVSLIASIPVIAAMLLAVLWPESPPWLAYKGKFDQCEKHFTRLRGTSDLAKVELEELILAQKENVKTEKWNNQPYLIYLWNKLKRRDFYLPAAHSFVLLAMGSWSGMLVIIIYASRIIQSTTQNQDAVFFGTITINCTIFIFLFINVLLVRYFRPEKVFLVCALGIIFCLLSTATANYCQIVGLMSKKSHICFYFLVGYMICMSLGVSPMIYSKATDIMPVKHRDLGTPLAVIFSCILETSSLKLAPYFFIYINIWGTMLIFAVNAILCTLFIWRYVPETRGKTLQQLEDYYAYGKFDVSRKSCAVFLHRPDNP